MAVVQDAAEVPLLRHDEKARPLSSSGAEAEIDERTRRARDAEAKVEKTLKNLIPELQERSKEASERVR